ncbi:MAG TPA: DsbA family protein [Solirubrobacteraceae bacterium]|nr:DsbA family protein [Solirubrobacteraceae bacterium]
MEPDDCRRPAFYFDLASPEAYLVAERVISLLPAAVWIPVLAVRLPAADTLEGFRCAADRAAFFDRIERSAARRGLQPVRWPDPFPCDSAFAMRAATYACQIGRAVAFSLAAFRQAFAGGRDLGAPDNVLIAAAACEMHPRAVLKGAAMRSIATGLEQATALAERRGVRDVPALWLPDDHHTDGTVRQGRVFHGDDALDGVARALTA